MKELRKGLRGRWKGLKGSWKGLKGSWKDLRGNRKVLRERKGKNKSELKTEKVLLCGGATCLLPL